MEQVQMYSHSPVKASNIVGVSVVNRANESLGDIKEIVIDTHSGKVAYAVVAFGGFLGMGEKLFAVPFGSLKYDVVESNYQLDMSKERLQEAPGFDPDSWPQMDQEQWNRDVYKFYNSVPYWQ